MLFGKKKNKKEIRKIDYSNLKMNVNLKSLCMYERLTGKSSFQIKVEDVVDVIYCIFLSNNPQYQITKDVFEILINENMELGETLINEYYKQTTLMSQFMQHKPNKEQSGETTEEEEVMLTSIVSNMIARGINPYYIYNDMTMPEIMELAKSFDELQKDEFQEERLFTYLTMLPHIDGNKLKGPEDILPFPWEKDKAKDKAMKDLKKNANMIKQRFAQLRAMKNKTEETTDKNG